MTSLNRSITARIDDLLRTARRSRASLGPILGLSQASVSDRFRGRTPWTTADLDKLADHFGVDARALLEPVTLDIDVEPGADR